MAATTLHLPGGPTVRTATARRFVVVYHDPARPATLGVEYRTDDLTRARKFVARGRTFRAIFDTTTGEVVR